MNISSLRFSLSKIFLVIATFPTYCLANNNSPINQQTKLKTAADEPVMIVTAPTSSPLLVVTSPKTPRQPVPASDGSDYLKTIPGFSQIRNGGTNGDPVLRGMFGSRLRILTDGSEILGACPSRMDAPTSYISPESYDLLTVTKGPQTVLWGPGNSAGTVQFKREQPKFDQPDIQGNADLLSASHHRWDGNADISLGNKQGYLRLIGNKSRSDDYKDGNGNRVPSYWDKWNTDINVGWTPDEDTLLEITAGQGDGKARYAGRGMDGSQFERKSAGVRFEKVNIGEFFDSIKANVYYNYANHIMDNTTLRMPGHMAMTSQLDRETVGGRVIARWLWSDFTLDAGSDMQTNRHRKNSMLSNWVTDTRFYDYGLFSELTWDITAQSKIISGARLDRTLVDNYTNKGSPKRNATMPAGFVRIEHNLANTPTMFYAGLGYTERFPDYWELFSPTYGANINSSAFDSIKPEKTTQLDIGAQYRSGNLNSWISAYLGKVNDFILFRYAANNPRLSTANNVNATIMGAEMGISYKLSDHWKTDTSLAYSWAENDSDKRPLPQIPPLEARFGLTWEKGNWSNTGLMRVVSKQNRIALNEGNVVGKDFNTSGGFTVFSANSAYKINQQISLSAGIDNIFNKQYSEHLNLAGNSSFGYSANTPVYEPGRTYWAKVNLSF